MKLRVLLAEDHAMFRAALRMTLQSAPDIEVVGEAEDGQQALASLDHVVPDIVCMDINMPVMDGIEATRRLLEIHPHVKVIGLSAHDDPVPIEALIKAGAVGYVIKSDAGTRLLAAIRMAVAS